jgi:hypothetical protein
MNTTAMFSSAHANWNTPASLIADIQAFFGQDFYDPCPPSPACDGLQEAWRSPTYCNPPYGRAIDKWVEKAMWTHGQSGCEIILLLPARTDTKWFQPMFAYDLCFMAGRLKFGGAKHGAPFPSVLAYMGQRSYEFMRAFQHRGVVVLSRYEEATAS